MILIDKVKPTQRIVFSANHFNVDGSFLLKITGDSSKESFQFNLDNNLSTDSDRYFMYQLETELFDAVPSGFYSYNIFKDALVVTSGKLYVKGIEVDNEQIFMPESPDDDEYIVYNGR